MKKVAICYWSGTGNTQAMAEAVAEGVKGAGAQAQVFTACEGKLSGKPIALFGSYGWGDGEWMSTWEDTCRGDGAELVCNSVICQETPDADALDACRALGAKLSQ